MTDLRPSKSVYLSLFPHLPRVQVGLACVAHVTGYITTDKARRVIKVEFSFDHLCWAETRWSHNDNQWEIFRPALSDLGCDIYINELTAEEVRGLDNDNEEGGDTRTTHTQTPAPSTASKGSEIAEEPERIIIHEAPRSGEQELVELAESLHISAHP